LLPNGKVFLMDQSPSPELLDVTTGTSQLLSFPPNTDPPPPQGFSPPPGAGYGATLLNSGQVLVVSEYKAFAYDYRSDTWSPVSANVSRQLSSSNTASITTTPVSLADGRVLDVNVLFGVRGGERSAYEAVYDPVANTATEFPITASIPGGIQLLADGKVLF